MSKVFLTRIEVFEGVNATDKINQIIRYLNAMKIQYSGEETDEDYKRFKEFVYKIE